MRIDQNQLSQKDSRVVGTVDGNDLHLLVTKGGLHVLVKRKKGSDDGEILGAGPHVAVARHNARKYAPNMKWTELNKSDPVEYIRYEAVLPEYERITQALRKANGDE